MAGFESHDQLTFDMRMGKHFISIRGFVFPWSKPRRAVFGLVGTGHGQFVGQVPVTEVGKGK